MSKNNILKAVAGVAIASAAVGGALAYIKRCKDVNDLSEDDFDDLLDDDEDCECPAERTYTTLPTEDAHESDSTAENVTADEAADSEPEEAEEAGSEEEAAEEEAPAEEDASEPEAE